MTIKVTLAYQCDLEDIPRTVFELLESLKRHSVPDIDSDLQSALINIDKKNIQETLDSMDRVRIKLAKMDQKLLDLETILTWYVKTDADLRMGVPPEQISSPSSTSQGTQEVSAQDILSEELRKEVQNL